MIAPENQRSQATAEEIEELISNFFDSADEDKDNAISEDEFIQGVNDMPIILQLLQADPGKQSRFDELDDDSGRKETEHVKQEISASGKKYAC